MKRIEIHHGDQVFLKSLNHTDGTYGSDKAMRDLVGTYITVFDFCEHYTYGIRIKHPSSFSIYSIHVNDLIPNRIVEEIDPNDDKEITMLGGKEVRFDEKLLFT